MKTFEQEKEEMVKSSERFADAAFPVSFEMQYETRPSMSFRSVSRGISRREYFSALAMLGLSASPNAGKYSAESIAKEAVKSADALIKELSK